MDSSYFSIIIFIIITIVYCFFGKPDITTSSYTPENELISNTNNLMTLGIYFLVVIFSQFTVNSIYLINKCGGSAVNNIGVAGFITFLPWIFIFGAVIAILIIFPGFKGAFSNVVGYFAISGKADEILGNILVDANIQQSINNEPITDESKSQLQKSAQLILKLCSNKSILINQMTPENFMKIWTVMLPLMKNGGNIPDIDSTKAELLKLVVTKDNIGEMMWYIYTGILLASIISFRLATQGCVKSVEQLKESHDEYLKKEQDAKKQQELNKAYPVTIK
jgi:hypothetical protein